MNVYEIDYLGTKPNNWKTKKFRQVFRFYKGLGITKDDLIEEGIPVISYGQVHSKDNFGFGLCDSLYRFVSDKYLQTDKKCLVHEGDFIFADTSEDYDGVGNCAFIDRDEDIFAGYHSMVASPIAGDTIYGKYFAFLFMTDFWRSQIRAEVMGIKVFSITQKLLRDTVVMIPPKDEQQAIADFLEDKCSQIDGIISDIEKQIDILKSYKKSLITETVTKGLDKNVKMKDSGVEWIGEIPEHWDVKRLGHISDMQNGYVGPTVDILVSEDEGEMYIQSLHVKNGKINFGNDFYVTEKWGKTHPKIYTGDVLVVQTGEIGQIGLVTEEYDGKNCHALIICHTHKEEIVPEYLIYYLMSDVGRWQLLQYETGTTLKHLNSGKIKCSKIIVPKIKEQQVIAEMLKKQCDEVDSIITTKQTQLTQMQQHKKSLIYEYVTGKRRVQGFGN